VLATSGNQDPATQAVSTEEPDDDRHILSWRGLLASRMFNSGTLVLVSRFLIVMLRGADKQTLVCVGVIYYVTDHGASSLSSPASIYKAAKQTLGALPKSNSFTTLPSELASLTPAESFWRSLNPSGWPFIRLVVPTASIIVLPTPGHPISPVDVLKLAATGRRRLPRLKPFFYLFKVVVLPQALTAGSLWALLAYLLKDRDLLDAQRDRAGRGEDVPLRSTGSGSGRLTADQLRVDMLPCGHASDIEVVASSKSGNLVVSVAIDDTISLWRFHETLGTGTRESLRSVRNLTGIAAATISSDERFVGVVTEDGTVQIWQLKIDGEATALEPISASLGHGILVVQMVFKPDQNMTEDPFRSTTNNVAAIPPVTLARSDGTVVILRSSGIETIVEGGEGQALLLQNDRGDQSAVLVCGDFTEALYIFSNNWSPIPLHSHRTAGEIMTAVSPLRSIERFTRKQVFAIGRQSGLVEIFDTTGTLVGAVGQSGQSSPLTQVDIVAPSSSRCSGCKVSCEEGFFVISTSSDQVYVDRVIPPSTLVCRCSASRRSIDEVSRLSISSPKSKTSELSLVVPPSASRARISPCTSPRKSPSLLPPTSNGEFPLSSHGTRKLSAYQSHDSMASNATPTSANIAVNSMGLSLNGNGSGSGFSDHDPFTNDQGQSTQAPTPDWTDMEVFPLGAISAPQGNWILVNDVLVGLRRSSPGINHDQWQLWTVDLTLPYNGTTLNVSTAPLAELEESTRHQLLDTLYADGDISSEHKRTERLLSLSGRASFPPIRGSFSVPTYPSLAYIEIQNLEPKGNGFVAAFGNQLGVITLPERVGQTDTSASQGYGLSVGVGMTPRSRLNSTSGQVNGNGNGTLLGLTPPPPRKFDDKKSN